MFIHDVELINYAVHFLLPC